MEAKAEGVAASRKLGEAHVLGVDQEKGTKLDKVHNLAFKVDPDKHDDGSKQFLGRTGRFDGVDILKIIFEQLRE